VLNWISRVKGTALPPLTGNPESVTIQKAGDTVFMPEVCVFRLLFSTNNLGKTVPVIQAAKGVSRYDANGNSKRTCLNPARYDNRWKVAAGKGSTGIYLE
jgi:hypothetical protein